MLRSISIALLKAAYTAKKAAGIALQPNHILQIDCQEARDAATMATAIAIELGEIVTSPSLIDNGIVDAAANTIVPDVDPETMAKAENIVALRMAVIAAQPAMMAYEEAIMAAMMNGDREERKRLRQLGCPEMKAAQKAYRTSVEEAGLDPFVDHCFDGWSK